MARAGWCAWVTGLPGSGKSVDSEALLAVLTKKEFPFNSCHLMLCVRF
jgi:adenylylsulfate kinase-like enzyme